MPENDSAGEKQDRKILQIVDQSNVVREILKKACRKLLPLGLRLSKLQNKLFNLSAYKSGGKQLCSPPDLQVRFA